MKVRLDNSKTLHKKIDLSKLQRLEDEVAMSSDALQARFERYRERIDSGRHLHRQALRTADVSNPAAFLPFADLAQLTADELSAEHISPDLVARAAIEFESAATLYAEWKRQSVELSNNRRLVERLRDFAEGVHA